jgi:uncharacterized protein (UPF0261 family)
LLYTGEGGDEMARKTIVVLATLDTKGEEAWYIKERLEAAGDKALIVDAGVVGVPACSADISREEVARAGGKELAELLEHPDREVAAPVMASGAAAIITKLQQEGTAHGIIAMGGTQGTTLCTGVMRELPYGFPKVMVSTMASGNVAPWVDIKDITMMFSVADIFGLNPVTRKILANAAWGVSGMAHADVDLVREDHPLIAVTTVGITTTGAMKAVEVLQDAGYETIVFHAVGPGGRAMEQMMREGIIGAVLDYSTIEVSNYMFDALLNGGEDRLTTAGKLGIPQVFGPGAIEVLVYNEPETVPPPFATRKLVRHSPKITDVRLNAEEMWKVGEEVAKRLSHTKGKAYFMIPTKGFDSYAVPGGPFWDPEGDRSFVDALKENLPEQIEIVERPLNIEDPEFAAECAEKLIELVRGGI